MVVVTTCVIIDKDLIQGHQCDVKMPVALMIKKTIVHTIRPDPYNVFLGRGQKGITWEE